MSPTGIILSSTEYAAPRAEERTMNLSDINRLDRDEFVIKLGSLFEGPAWIVEEAWARRPFSDEAALHRALCAVMNAAPRESQLALLSAHPDLAGKLARAGKLTPDSTREQAAAGLDRLTPAELREFTRLNASYRERFGFPFILCARLSTKEGIHAALLERLQHTREEEVQTALAEVSKICALRLHDMLADTGTK